MMMRSFIRRGLAGLALVACPALAHAQTATPTGVVRGKVTEATNGQGIPDAQVLVVGARLGAVTNGAGEYTLPGVPAGSRTIGVRRIGYQAASKLVTVIAGVTQTVDFTMRTSGVNLAEVVVTGTGAPTEKRKVGTSIASVDSSVLGRAPATTLDQAMQGKIAGAQITQNSGGPGGGGISVRLRGTNSFISGSDPLYIVDGVIIDNGSGQLTDLGGRSNPQNRLADLNPNDIERIEVIRGAAAAALYGSRANNGVVQIFTKRGSIGKPKFTFTSRYGESSLRAQQPFNLFPYDVNGISTRRFNYQNDIFRIAPVLEQTLTVEGGNDQTRFFISANALKDEGILKSTSSERQGARINIQQTLSDQLILNVGADFVQTHNELQAFGEQNEYGIMGSLFFAPTQVDFRPVNGVYPLPPSLGTNPLLAIDRIRNPQQVNRFIGSSKLSWTPDPNLTMSYTLGLDYNNFEQRQFIPRGAILGTAPNSTGRAQSTFQDTKVLNQDGVASYNWRAGSDFDLRTTAGFNYTQQQINSTTAVNFGLAPSGELLSAGSNPSVSQASVELRTLGFYGQQEVAWKDRLFLVAAVRYDASSTFAPAERWQVFPKVSASYVAVDNQAGNFNSLRLRGAMGWAGSQPGIVNAYSQFVTFAQSPFANRPGFVNDVTFGNPSLRNERAREWELGADAGFLNGRVGVEATYYDRLVSDLLFFRPLPTSTGFSRQFYPIGSMSNKGFELLVRTLNVDTRDVKWESTITYAANQNRIESLDIQDFQSAGGYPNRIRVGYPVGSFYGSYAARNCATGAFLLDSLGRLRRSNQTADMGNATQRQAISGGTCNDSLNAVIGDPNPKWTGSLLNELTFGRKVRLRVLLDGVYGNDVMNLSTRAQNAGIASNSKSYERELLPYGDPRKLAPGYNGRSQGVFQYWIENGSFTKLRELSISYLMDWEPVKRYVKDGIELTLSGRNLYVWTSYSGYDPELNLFGTNAGGLGSAQTTAADRGFDFGGYPIPQTWSISARFSF